MWSVGFSKRRVLIGRTGFDTVLSIPDPTLSLSYNHVVNESDKHHIVKQSDEHHMN
jgi:hypothetical protein